MATVFDGPNKLITLTTGTTSLSVQTLWSDWVRWHATSDNGKYLAAFRQAGGDTIDLAEGTFVPCYLYCANGWRIRPQEADHVLHVTNGALLVDGGGNPFVPTLGGFTVQVNYAQPVAAIGVSNSSSVSAESIAAAVWAHLLTTGVSAENTLLKTKQMAENAFAVSA